MDELIKHELTALRAENEGLKAIVEGLEKEINELRQKYDALDRSHKRLGDIRNRLAKENEELKQQNKKVGNRCEDEYHRREYWRLQCNGRGDRIRELEREIEDLKAKTDNELAYYRIKQLEETNERLKSQLMETNDTLDNLQRQFDAIKHKDAVFVDLDSSKLKGMEELWGMLGTMYAADPIEVTKIFGWFSINNIAHYTPDVSEFLKKYKAWKSGKDEKEAEQKRLDYIRDYLHRFCLGKVCYGCPLNTPEFKCYGPCGFDSISDEDLKKYYEKAWNSFKEEKPSDEEVPCSFGWKIDGTEYTIETSIPREAYDNIVKIISGKE